MAITNHKPTFNSRGHEHFEQDSSGSPVGGEEFGTFDSFNTSCGNTSVNLSSFAMVGSVDRVASGGSISSIGSAISIQTTANANGTTTDTVTFAGSGIVFNNTFTASVTQAYKNCIISAEQAIASTWTNSVTINEEFDAQAQGLSGTLASNSFFVDGVSYSSLKNALASLAMTENNTYLQQAVANLPSTDPSGGKGFELALPYARMLGLTSSSQNPDDAVTLNTSYNWNYGQDVINTVEHEITEGGMGRIGGLGDQNSFWSVMDLFRYNSSGQLDETDGRDGKTTYFSYDGGKTLSLSASLAFNNEYNSNGVKINGGDTADFTEQDVFGTGNPGETNTLSLTDLQIIDALGWNPAVASNPAPPAGTTADMIMSQNGTGNYEIYDIGQNAILAAYHLVQISSPWQVVGLGGFNGSDTTDMFMRNTSTGAFQLYDVSNNNVTGSVSMGQVGLEWAVSGFGDFSGLAGETDMLMRNNNTGQFELYDISNNQYTGFHSIGSVGLQWSVAGFGDFSGNANESDLLMRNSNTGQLELYDISNNQSTGPFAMGQVGLEWSVAGFGDFSGNANETDMLMRNNSTGQFELYDISNNQYTGFHSMGQVGLEWSVAGFGDFSGNANETDMLMRNNNTGQFELYDISNNQYTGFHSMGQVGLEWSVSGIAVDPPSAAEEPQSATAGDDGNAKTPMPDMVTLLGAGGSANFVDNGGNEGSSGSLLPDPGSASANWLTEAIQSGSPATSFADQAIVPRSNGSGVVVTPVGMTSPGASFGVNGADLINTGGNDSSSGSFLQNPSSTLANWLTEAIQSGSQTAGYADPALLSSDRGLGASPSSTAVTENAPQVAGAYTLPRTL